MQFYQQRYPRVVKLRSQEKGLVVVEDSHSGERFAFDHPHFSTIYEKISLRHALHALERGGRSVTLEDVHSSLCRRQGTTTKDRAVLVVALFLSVLLLFAGVRDSRLLRVVFILIRLAAAHGTSLERIILNQQLVGGQDV